MARSCFHDVSSSATGRKLIRAKAPARGLVSVRLSSAGDWDLGVFGRRGRLVAGSASFGGNELASGFVRRGERLVVQVCRFRGNAAQRARIDPLHPHREDEGAPLLARGRGHAEAGGPPAAPGPRPRRDRARRRRLGHGAAPRPRRRAHAARGRLPVPRAGRRPRGPGAPQRAPRRRGRAHGPVLRAAQRPHDLPAPARLRPRDEEPRAAVPDAGQADHAQPPQRPRPRRERDRDLDGRAEHRGRQADLPDHGRAPRARVAVGGAHDRVRLRPAAQLRAERADDAARPEHADDRDPGREPGRLQHLARGRHARRLLAVRLRDEAQELPRVGQHPEQVREGRLRRQQGRPPARHRPEPQLRRPVGRQRREHDLVGRHLPRRRAVLRARGAERPRADLVAAGDQPDHEPHVLEPGAARAGGRELRLPAGGADLQGAGRVARRPQRLLEHPGLRALRHHGRDRGLVVLVDRRAGVHVRDRRGRLPSGLPRRRRGGVPRRGARDRCRQGRQPRGVLHDAAGDRRQLAPLADRGRRARRIDAEDLEDVPDLDLAGLAGRPRRVRSATRGCSPTR